MISRLFLEHPRSVDENYIQHAWFAAKFSMLLFVAALAALVHAILPFMFEKIASRIITRLYNRIHNRGQ